MPVIKIFCLLTAIFATTAARADTLLIDGVERSAQSASLRPTRGMTMAAVEARHGAPSTRTPAVGEPPIARWEYPGFTVYFEFDRVIHSVEQR